MQAYVGIASHRGLEMFFPEHPHAVRFICRRAERQSGRVCCFWSVLADDVIALIELAMRKGRNAEALSLLQQGAREYGSLVAFNKEDLATLAGR